MAVGVAGEEIVPIDNADFDSLSLTPTVAAGAASQVLTFNNSYAIWVDNADNGGGSGTRWWLDTPDNADVVIGPRAGGNAMAGLRLRTDRTTANAANANLDAATYELRRSTSSSKYKQDVESHELDLTALRKLRPVRYRDRGEVAERESWEQRRAAAKDNPAILRLLAEHEPPVPRTYVGLIAEEVHELGLHAFVQYGAQGEPDGLAYDRIVVGALALIRQQDERLAALEARLTKLEARPPAAGAQSR